MKPLLIATALILTSVASTASAGGYSVGSVAQTLTFPPSDSQPVTKNVTVIRK